jgi:crotonobetainyl-CoA:carnitine CoA-transferase CaiB-like acyl-CoA transferase
MTGVKVVEMGVWVAGPACGAILADWGAEVVKIEPTRVGDPSRLFASMFGPELPVNPPFEMDNRGKRSIAIDVASDAGREIALELVDGADVFVTNVRMAGLERLGFAWPQLRARNPRLVYGAISGYGFDGPDADLAGYDIAAFWARSGIAHMLTQPGQHPPFQRGGMGDHNAGLACAGAVSAALFARERSGQGQLVTTSLLREGIYTLSFDFAFLTRLGVEVGVADRATMGNPCINNYRDRDGRWFWIVGLEANRHWPPLCRAVGRPEWIDDPRYADTASRSTHAAELIRELDAIFATRTREAWGEVFAAEPELWWAPVQSLGEVLADPQATAAGGFVEVPDGAGSAMLPATPVDFDGHHATPRRPPPAHGGHTDEVLSELGRSADEIAALRQRGVVA